MRKTSSPMRYTCMLVIKLVFIMPYHLICWAMSKLFSFRTRRSEIQFDNYDEPETGEEADIVENSDDEINDEIDKYSNLPEMPEMCQIFPIGEDTCIGVQFVSRCPEETAHIRIIGDTSFSKIYKRRVYTEGNYDKARFFKLNNEKYYLNNEKTKVQENKEG